MRSFPPVLSSSSIMATDKVAKKSSKSKTSRSSSTKTPAKTSFKSPENISDSDLESDKSDATPAESKSTPVSKAKVTSVDTGNSAKKRKIDVTRETVLPQTNGHSKAASESESSPDASDDEEDDAPAEKEDIEMVDADEEADEQEGGEEAEEETEEEEDSDEETDSDSDSDDGIPLDTPKSKSQKSIEASTKQKAVTSKTINDWKPPSGFTRINLPSSSSSSVRKLLGPSALRGKQLWHISIPEGLESSLLKIKTLQPGAIHHGEAVLRTGDGDGDGYTFRETRKRDVEGVRILVPDGESNQYKQLEVPVARTLDLQHVMSGANGDAEEEEGWTLDPKLLVAQWTYEKEKPPKQVEGLQVHNVPIGVVMAAVAEPAKFKQPKTIPDVVMNGIEEIRKSKSREEETPAEKAQRKAEKAKRKAAKEQKKLTKAGAR